MSRIFSDSIFHYTDCEDALVGILEKGFQVKCCKEQFIDPAGHYAYIDIPLVSFCDIPLNCIQYIIYVGYAVGLTRTWANDNRLAPVSYYLNSKDSFSNQSMRKAYEEYMNSKTKDSQRILAYLKPMRKYKDGNYGVKTLSNGKQIVLRRDNYIEREWRKAYLSRWDQGDYYLNKPSYVTFKSEDVSFIIVPESGERSSIISRIKELTMVGGRNTSPSGIDIESLISKVLTIGEIKKNF